MKSEINMEKLQQYLREEIYPQRLSKLLDELAFEYMRLLVGMHQPAEQDGEYIHEHTSSFLYHLRRLRDLFNECSAKE